MRKKLLSVLMAAIAMSTAAPAAHADGHDGYYQLRNKATARCLAGMSDGSVVTQPCNAALRQLWRFDLSTGLIRNYDYRLCLDDITADLVVVRMSGCSKDDPGQIWDVPMTRSGESGRINNLFDVRDRELVGWASGAVNVVAPDLADVPGKVTWIMDLGGSVVGGGGGGVPDPPAVGGGGR
ncbi:RICIN domain-containing protein [Peterkaempfera bronchialis]|uniref:RICIN domain-containing protein n=1 Tax=Peterkaempfera bronchialis TaxID=2126346 RepID=UPI003C308BDE